MTIAIPKLTEVDKGKWVEYVGHAGERETGVFFSSAVKGRIKSWNQTFIFVVFHCDNNWDRYYDYTGCACKPTQLRFTETPKNKKEGE
jgi:hypothetical protein